MEDPMNSPGFCALFVAFFDPVEGNKLEWSACSANSPDKTILLNNIEMLVLAPGFEKIDDDYVLFRHNSISNIFGCSAFHKLATTDAAERFARMRSVGVMGSCVTDMRKLVPLLTLLATRCNSEPDDKNLLEKVSQRLFEKSTTDLETLIDNCFSDIQNNPAPCHPSANIDKHLQPQIPLKVNIPNKLSVDHSSYLVIWRAVLSKYRVLIYSKRNAGFLCDLTLDLLKSGCSDISQPLMFRTYDSDESIFQPSNSAWFASTTDMRLVLGMGQPGLCWDILIDFDDGTSGAHFKQDKNSGVVQSERIECSNTLVNVSSFTVHMTANCDERVRRCIHKNNLPLWTTVTEHGANATNQSDTVIWYADERLAYLSTWWKSFEMDVKAISSNFPEENNIQKSKQMRKQYIGSIMTLLKKHAIDSVHVPWLLYFCVKHGVDVSDISAIAIMKLKLELFSKNMLKLKGSKKVVPMNS